MREAMIILPEGDDAIHAALSRELCKLFGGCTISSARGLWIDPGNKLFDEPVRQYVVACEDNATSRVTLQTLATSIGRLAKQQSMYLRFPSGDVEFIDIKPLTLAA